MQLATRYFDEIAESPIMQRVLMPSAWSCPIVGKASPAVSRYDRRKEREKLVRFAEAVMFAYAMDWPLNIGLTITWAALQAAGEKNEGHCLWRGEWEREGYVRDELARLCRSNGLPLAALWGRDVGAAMGSHSHLSMFWPSHKLAQLIAVIERISGSSADFVLEPYAADVVARSVCGGWQLNMNNRKDDKTSAMNGRNTLQPSMTSTRPRQRSRARRSAYPKR